MGMGMKKDIKYEKNTFGFGTSNQFTGLSNDELLNILMVFYKDHGRCPIVSELKEENNLPSSSLYFRGFETCSFNKILKMAGLKSDYPRYTKDEALENFMKYYQQLGRIPTSGDFKRNKHWKPGIDFYHYNFGGIKKTALLCGLIDKIYTISELIDISIQEMRDLAEELGRCPTVEEYETNRKNGLSRKALENNASMKYNDICRKYLPEYDLNHDLDRYNDFTTEDYKNMLIDIKNEIGRLPFAQELNKYGLPSYNVLQRKFGMTYNQLIESFGWEPVGSLLGKTYLDGNGNQCFSVAEVVISNFFIVNNINYERGNLYSEIMDGDTRSFDWKLLLENNKYFYVEYFGLYQEKPTSDLTRLYRRRTKGKINDLRKYGVSDNCIFIFPYDFASKKLSSIFEPYVGRKLRDVSPVELQDMSNMKDVDVPDIINT